MKLLLPAVVLCAGGTVAAWTHGSSDEVLPPTFDGVAQPHRVIHLGAATDGLLRSVSVDLGDHVEAGQVVAQIDVAVAEAQVELARATAERGTQRAIVEARLRDARRRLAKQESLLADGIAMVETVDAIRTEVQLEELALAREAEQQTIAELELRRAEATVAQATIATPVTGVVLERHLSPGEILSRAGQDEVLTIAELDPLVVEVHVPIEHYDRIQLGTRAVVRLDGTGQATHTAEVRAKNAVVETASRTFRVQLHLPNPDHRLPAGLRCRVSFE